MKPIKPKKCKVCKVEFTPTKPLQQVCGFECALELAKDKRIKTVKKEVKEAKLKLKSRSDWLKDTQVTFNKYIRLRDQNDGCISCGSTSASAYHAGHYRSIGSAGHLRFNELNCHRQCAACNTHLSGNLIRYRVGLVRKIGIQLVEALESNNNTVKWNIEDIQLLKKQYSVKIKALNLDGRG
ncbi:Bacteriophage lambda NinG [uncultured Caudovirales phage]|uniref:Protein ninG n=1 Tax=uncultured Caudovirales phage TaxID=2100421 RepID=A0A6J5L3H9_9CAUD|nr:Bacteriophage lambda NinG [uncultured Caudovirales phage]